MAGINKGDSLVSRITVGDNNVSEVYKGDTLIWQGDTQYSDPFWDNGDVLFLIPADNPDSSNPNLLVRRPSEAGIIAAFLFNGTGGNTVVNADKDGYNGIRVGKPVSAGSGVNAGYFAVAADSASGSIIFPASTPFTIEFWLYYAGATILEGSNSTVTYLHWSSNAGLQYPGNYQMGAKTAGTATTAPSFLRSSSTTSYTAIENDDPITVLGQWQHHAVVRDDDNYIKYYIDGRVGDGVVQDSAVYGRSDTSAVFGGIPSNRTYGCNAIVRQIRYTKAARYTADFTPYQRFYYPGIS